MAAPKRFFVPNIGEEVVLSGEEFRHASQVLRLKTGDEVTLLDGSGAEYSAVIAACSKREMLLNVLNKTVSDKEPETQVTLLFGALKGDKSELVVQKTRRAGGGKAVPARPRARNYSLSRSRKRAFLGASLQKQALRLRIFRDGRRGLYIARRADGARRRERRRLLARRIRTGEGARLYGRFARKTHPARGNGVHRPSFRCDARAGGMAMKACVFTLGCKLNEVESASLMSGLKALGYETTEELGYADLYLLNTCAVTKEAEKKSRQAVARMRKYNPDAPVIVCGCAAQHHAEDFWGREGVVLVTGAQGKGRLLELLREGKQGVFVEPEQGLEELPAPQKTKTRAYLRIQDGCDRFCSYCLIPYLRGRSRSRKKEAIVKEALASSAKELVLTGVDISDYHDGECDLAGLVRLLKEVPARIRLGSVEESAVTDELLLAMKEGNFMPHFHLSLQSGSDAVLRAMNRRYTRAEYLSACRKIYEAFPDAAITTDIIVGFPGETEEDFQASLSIVKEAGFSRVHVFPFSPREGTVAFKKPDLPASLKHERVQRLISAAKEAEEAYLARFVGRESEVLFEADGGYTPNYLRVYADGAEEGSLWRVKLMGREKDGLSAQLLHPLA